MPAPLTAQEIAQAHQRINEGIKNNDHYKVLGVDSKASPAEIKAAYKQAAFAAHPDRTQNQDPTLMQAVGKAYSTLNDPVEKSVYDRERRESKNQANTNAKPNTKPNTASNTSNPTPTPTTPKPNATSATSSAASGMANESGIVPFVAGMTPMPTPQASQKKENKKADKEDKAKEANPYAGFKMNISQEDDPDMAFIKELNNWVVENKAAVEEKQKEIAMYAINGVADLSKKAFQGAMDFLKSDKNASNKQENPENNEQAENSAQNKEPLLLMSAQTDTSTTKMDANSLPEVPAIEAAQSDAPSSEPGLGVNKDTSLDDSNDNTAAIPA